MKRLPAMLRCYGVVMALGVLLVSAWLTSIFAADSLLVNLPSLSRTFTFGQSSGMIGFGSQSRRATLDFGCGAAVFGSMAGPICLWRNPHGPSHRRFEIPLPLRWEMNEYYWSFAVSHWLLGSFSFGAWLGWRRWRSRRMEQVVPEMAAELR